MKANGTVAKDIALHFLQATEIRYTKSIISKTIIQAKQLLEAGYTKDEIISCINWVIDNTEVQMYSLGYINTMINKILIEVDAQQRQQKLLELTLKLEEDKQKYMESMKEVGEKDSDTEERNRQKLNRFGFKSRFGKELDFDMLEESGEDN